MNNDVKYVIEKLTKYSKTPSLSFHEQEFMEVLRKDIPLKNSWVRDTDRLYYLSPKETPYLVTCHIDRIPVNPFYFQFIDDKTKLKGQLDNCISVAIARWCIENQILVDILFTTKEEVLRSHEQIVEVYHSKEYKGIFDLDIDVTVAPFEVESGAISLRDHDCIVDYDEELVAFARGLAKENSIEFITKDTDWLMCQAGTAIRRDKTVKAMYLGLPIDFYHSNKEVINLKCIENAIEFFKALKRSINVKQDSSVSVG